MTHTGDNELYVSASSRHLGFGGGGAGFSLMLDGGKLGYVYACRLFMIGLSQSKVH